MFALVDCNNFYVSCERVFNPRLAGPVAVLSNNDGCIVARSQEVKDLGVPMGAAYFEYKELFERHRVKIFSSNYTLYGDMSDRVMETLKTFTPDVQVYSVDEAFLFFSRTQTKDQLLGIRKRIKQWTGIPVSIGMARTKTLAKMANYLAKKTQSGVVVLSTDDEVRCALNELPVEDIWGIGRQYSRLLRSKGIHSALQFRNAEDAWVRKHMSVVGLRTVWELRGTSCLPLDELPVAKKSVICSKSFGYPIDNFEELCEATATYVARACEKIRAQDSLASYLSIFAVMHERQDHYFPTYKNGITLAEPTSYTPTLITAAKQLLRTIYRDGIRYRKTGVCLGGLIPRSQAQLDLFEGHGKLKEKQGKVMHIMDTLNAEYGKNGQHGKKALRSAAEGSPVPAWGMRRNMRSPAYTTNWNELLTVGSPDPTRA